MSLLLWQVLRTGGGGASAGRLSTTASTTRLLIAKNKSRGTSNSVITSGRILRPTLDNNVSFFATSSSSPSNAADQSSLPPKPSPGGPSYRREFVPPPPPPKPPKPSPGGRPYFSNNPLPKIPKRSTSRSRRHDKIIIPLDVLRFKSKNLLGAPIGSWKENQWRDCVWLIHQWTGSSLEELEDIQRMQREGAHNNISIAALLAFSGTKTTTTTTTGESVIASFSLLERLLVEYKRRGGSGSSDILAQELLKTSLLNACVYNWAKCWKSLHLPTTTTGATTNRKGNNSPSSQEAAAGAKTEVVLAVEMVEDAQNQAEILLSFSPENILGRIDGYENRTAQDRLLLPDRLTYETVVAAAAASSSRRVSTAGGNTNNNTIAVKVLDKMTTTPLDNNNTTTTTTPPPPPPPVRMIDRMVYVKLLQLYAQMGIGEEAEAVLEHMFQQFVKTGSKDLMPTTKEFHQVLLAWSETPAASTTTSSNSEEEEEQEVGSRSDDDNNNNKNTKNNLKYAIDRSLAILKRMDKLSEQDGGKLHGVANPDGSCYSVVLRCLWRWLASEVIPEKAGNAAEFEYVGELAEDLLRDLQNRYENGGGRSVQPGVGIYNKVLLIWSQLGNATRAERLLQEMYEDYLHNNNFRAKPTEYSFDLVLSARWNQLKSEWASNNIRSSRDSKEPSSAGGERAEAIFRRMQEVGSDSLGGVKPTDRSWLTVIHCWSETRCKQAGDRALAILEEAKAVEEETGEQILNKVHYGAVIHAFAASGNAQGAEKVMAQFHRQYHEEGNVHAKPSAQTITILINAWAKSNDPRAAERADTLLQEMKRLHHEGILDAPPHTIAYASVIDCYAKSSLPEATERAEALLEEMQRASRDGVNQVRPNVVAYRNLLHGYANRGDVEKAEALLERMFEEYKRGNLEAKPNSRAMNLVLSALSKSNYADAGTRAIVHLKRMENLYEMGKIEDPPGVVAYTLAIKCISEAAKGNQELAFDQAENLLEKMELRASKGETFMAPNTMTYSTIIQIYGRCGMPEKAEAMLRHMYKQYTEGNTNAAPNARTFTSVLQAWSRAGSESSLENVLSILSWMKQLHEDNVLDDVKPNAYSYQGALHCLLKLPRKDASFACQKAVDILSEMENLADDDDTELPNVTCYNQFLRVFANFGEGIKAQELIASMYQKFESGKLSGKPDILSWQLVLEAWSRSMDPSAPSRVSMILKRMNELCDNGTLEERPHASTCFALLDSFLSSRHGELLEHIAPLLEEVDSLTLSGEQQSKSMRLQMKVIRALCKLRDDDMLVRAERILHRMIKHNRSTSQWNGNAVRASYNDLIEAWSKSRDQQAKIHTGRLQQELKALDISSWEE